MVMCLVASQGALAAGDPGAGKGKAAACAACHGADGNSSNPEWPKLAGQNAGYLSKQLREFKNGKRTNATMNGMAAGLSDQDMEDIAAYFEGETIKGGSAEPKEVARGEKLYRGGDTRRGIPACMACHGPAGSGNPAAKFPAVAGQHAAYTASALKAFRAGERSNDPNEMMRRVAANMADRDIKAVAEYMAGLYQ